MFQQNSSRLCCEIAKRVCPGLILPTAVSSSARDRLQRMIQYSRDVSDRIEKPRRTGYPESVIGLAEGETRWRGMTPLICYDAITTTIVIPGRAKREPGIHNHRRDYGFRACAKWRIPE